MLCGRLLLAVENISRTKGSTYPRSANGCVGQESSVVGKSTKGCRGTKSPPPAPIIVCGLPKLKISLTYGKREDRTLILDNSKGGSKLRDFVINGLEYQLHMRGVMNGQARIEQRNPLPGPLNFKPFDIEKGATKPCNLNQGQSAIAIHMHEQVIGSSCESYNRRTMPLLWRPQQALARSTFLLRRAPSTGRR